VEYNVMYDRGDGTSSTYLLCWVSKSEAVKWAKDFTERYVGKPYPNGKGWYPFNNVRVVSRQK
jgi:hypothetical protein